MYARLGKPTWAPQRRCSARWSGLYILMAVAAWRGWRSGRSQVPLTLHGIQLGLNAAWPAAFFTVGDRPRALGIVVALDAVLAAEMATPARRDRLAAALLAPYLAWSLYATALTASVSDPA